MWRTQKGDRVLTEAEWMLFSVGLNALRDSVEEDISNETNDTDTGVPVFDRLTPEQKLALLSDTAHALHDPVIPTPVHTAVNEGAIMAAFSMLQIELEEELEIACTTDKTYTHIRPLLLAACDGEADRDEPLPDLHTADPEGWNWLMEEVKDGVFWDYDFAMGDQFLDLPPDEARRKLKLCGIDPDYYLETPPEPGKKGLIAARQTLARLIGLPVPDDDGFYPALEDLYHDLWVGPVTAEEIAAWDDHPWVQIIGSPEPEWECDYTKWREEFRGALPAVPFQVNRANAGISQNLPSGKRAEPFGKAWVIRDEAGSYWCGMTENGWTDHPNDDTTVLLFATEVDAKVAYVQADGMYGERAARHEQAISRLKLTEE